MTTHKPKEPELMPLSGTLVTKLGKHGTLTLQHVNCNLDTLMELTPNETNHLRELLSRPNTGNAELICSALETAQNFRMATALHSETGLQAADIIESLATAIQHQDPAPGRVSIDRADLEALLADRISTIGRASVGDELIGRCEQALQESDNG